MSSARPTLCCPLECRCAQVCRYNRPKVYHSLVPACLLIVCICLYEPGIARKPKLCSDAPTQNMAVPATDHSKMLFQERSLCLSVYRSCRSYYHNLGASCCSKPDALCKHRANGLPLNAGQRASYSHDTACYFTCDAVHNTLCY